MLLAVDIGNTNIDVGLFEGDKLYVNWNLNTDIYKSADEYAVILLGLLRELGRNRSEVDTAAICSVSPPLIPVFRELCHNYFNLTPMIVEAGVKTGVSILMDNPREVGPDRIVNAVGGHHLYGGPLIVIDLGTATLNMYAYSPATGRVEKGEIPVDLKKLFSQ